MAQKRRLRKPMTMQRLQSTMTRAILELENIYLADPDSEVRIRACNSLATLANSYTRLMEVADLETRLSELESTIKLNSY